MEGAFGRATNRYTGTRFLAVHMPRLVPTASVYRYISHQDLEGCTHLPQTRLISSIPGTAFSAGHGPHGYGTPTYARIRPPAAHDPLILNLDKA